VLCVLHAGGKFGGEESGYRVSGGLHGVGISVVNALSDSLTVEVVRENIHHSMSFARGDPVSDMRTRPAIEGEHRGTRVTFKPDSSIFKTTTVFDVEKIAERLDELAYLNAGLKISLIDHRCNTTTETSSAEIIQKQPIQKEFLHKGGIKELVSSMCQGKSPMHAEQGVIEFKQDRKGVAVEVALRWSKDMYSEALSGFANGIRTSDGGSHLDGLKQAISKTMNGFARQVRFMNIVKVVP
jgi:DNA gyrase subunit B